MIDSQTIGARLRQAREQRGIAQGDFAELVEKDQRTISEYEHGKRRISAIDLLNFAHALEISVLYFYEGEISSDDFDRMLLDEFHQLPLEAKADAVEVMRNLVNLSRKFAP